MSKVTGCTPWSKLQILSDSDTSVSSTIKRTTLVRMLKAGEAVRVSGQRLYWKSMSRAILLWTQKPLKKNKVHFFKKWELHTSGTICFSNTWNYYLISKRSVLNEVYNQLFTFWKNIILEFMPPCGSLSRITEHVFQWWSFSLGWTHR